MKTIIFILCTVMFFGTFTIPGKAAAFNVADVQKLKTTNSCIRCDLSGANLNGAALSNAQLDGATWTDGSICKQGSVGECKK